MEGDSLSWNTGEHIVDHELDFIVGREPELAVFEHMLGKLQRHEPRVLHIHGTGGVGKSTFLRLCRQKAREVGSLYIQLDSRDFIHTEQGIGTALLSQIGIIHSHEDDTLRLFAEMLGELPEENSVVIAIDTFEEMQDMGNWLRERLISRLPARLLLLTTGRHPLRGGGLLSPYWRKNIKQLPLAELNHQECTRYLVMCGITDELLAEQIWRRTNGHPLAMSLAAASHTIHTNIGASDASDWFGQLAALWLQEVREYEFVRYLEAASVLRVFDQEKLSYIMDEAVSPDLFDRLIAMSFVHHRERGWQIHDLMRESINLRLKERTPKRYRELTEKCAGYYAKAILESRDRSRMEWEVGELFRYADVDVLRALTSDDDRRYYWETVTETTLRDALVYAKWRETNTQSVYGTEVDPVTGKAFRIEYTAEQVRLNAAPLDLEALYRLEPSSLRLLRDAEEKVCALAICIPFHEGTLSWLEADPLCSPYLNTLAESERKELATLREHPAGWFLRSFNFIDILDPKIRTAGIRLIYSFLCRGGISVCTLYDSEIGRRAYTAFGFRPVEGATHYHYDGRTRTPTYVLDTRGDRLPKFLNQLFQRMGMDIGLESECSRGNVTYDPRLLRLLSEREYEVALEVVAGYSNAEIAERLYISENTVKKHIKSIFVKLGISKRTQVFAKLLYKRSPSS